VDLLLQEIVLTDAAAAGARCCWLGLRRQTPADAASCLLVLPTAVEADRKQLL
jgi:hypothetical protein